MNLKINLIILIFYVIIITQGKTEKTVKKYKKHLDKIKDSLNVEDKLKEINSKYYSSLENFKDNFNKIKSETLNQSKKLQSEYEEKYSKMNKEIYELKRQTEYKIKELQNLNDSYKKQLTELESKNKNSRSFRCYEINEI